MSSSDELPQSRTDKPFLPSEWKTFRALVSFSIKLRHQEEFQRVIRRQRQEWSIDELGDWYRPNQVELLVRRPVVFPVGEGAFMGVYPPHVDETDAQEAAAFESDVGLLVRRFVDLKRFPPQYVRSIDTAPSIKLARFHPLSPFVACCIRFAILSLPGSVGIARPPYRVRDPSVDGDLLYLPPEATKEEAHARVDQIYDDRRHESKSDQQTDRIGRRTREDLLRTYEAWRLRAGGKPLAAIADGLVEMGLDDTPAAESTISTRIARASEIWDLPEPSPGD